MLCIYCAPLMFRRKWNYISDAGDVSVYDAPHFDDGYGGTA